ncbi:MAG: ribbon-helix-helix protein, CopG family [Trueperaceae bacterium]|nr:ribbon-helix-helix protein, CopG family [Trueperaceae bacterium]
MSQVTIYLEPELAERMRAAAESDGVSQSKWVAALVRQRLETQWPQEVRLLAGAWPDFPEVEEIRAAPGEDVPREEF